MSNTLLVEDVSRIKFLMGYDSTKVFSEQIDYNTNSDIILEQNPSVPKQPVPKQPSQNLTNRCQQRLLIQYFKNC